MISIKETIAVPSPPGRVWDVLSDPSEVVSCISGAELGEAHEDGSFDGALVVRFGAVRVRFNARIRLELAEQEREGRLSARGRDGQAATRFNAQATFRVEPDEEAGGARVELDGEVQLTGKLASLIESGAGAVVSRMTGDFSAQLVQRCAGPAAGTPAGTPTADRPTDPAATGPARRPGLIARLRAWWARIRPGRQDRETTAPHQHTEGRDHDRVQAQ